MSNLAIADLPEDWDEIIENLVTEDDEPVETVFGAKQPRLLLEILNTAWTPPPGEDEAEKPREFFADSNIGIFTGVNRPPIVPDLFLTLDVAAKKDWTQKKNRSYFLWEYEKAPDLVLEIVSNKIGGELEGKMKRYAEMRVPYYVVFDPLHQLSQDALRVYELSFGGRSYRRRPDYAVPALGLGLTLWRGEYERYEFEWLRWCDEAGRLLPTAQEHHAAETQARQEAEARCREEARRAERLAAKLRELGLDPAEL